MSDQAGQRLPDQPAADEDQEDVDQRVEARALDAAAKPDEHNCPHPIRQKPAFRRQGSQVVFWK